MRKHINDYSIEELQALIEQKKKEEREAPAPLVSPNFSPIINMVKEYISDLEKGREPADSKQWIFEAAVEAVYGRKIWDWVNKRH